jgi:hypothetical protein
MVSEIQNTPEARIPPPSTPVQVGWPVASTAVLADSP